MPIRCHILARTRSGRWLLPLRDWVVVEPCVRPDEIVRVQDGSDTVIRKEAQQIKSQLTESVSIQDELCARNFYSDCLITMLKQPATPDTFGSTELTGKKISFPFLHLTKK